LQTARGAGNVISRTFVSLLWQNRQVDGLQSSLGKLVPGGYHRTVEFPYKNHGLADSIVTLLYGIVAPLVVSLLLWVILALYGETVRQPYQILMVIAALLSLLLFRKSSRTAYQIAPRFGWARIGSVGLKWITLVGLLLLVGYATKTSDSYSRRVLFTWFLATPAVLLLAFSAIDIAFLPIARRATRMRRAAIAGVNELGNALAERIAKDDALRISLVGFFDDRSSERLGEMIQGKLLGKLHDITDLVRHGELDVLFIALPIKNVKRVTQLLDELHDSTVSIYFLPDIFVFDLIQCRTTEIGGLPAVALCETPFYGPSGLLKRISDIVIASVALIAISPLMLIIAVAIKLTSPGSVIFRQRRYGLDGRQIIVYKFRSMRVSEDGEKIVQASVDDPRITPVGRLLRRFSLDELPQFINVLQGRMSVVGPRPHAVAHNEEYRTLIKGYMLRHKVRPGITGLAQVNGLRGETKTLDEMRRRVDYDLDYLRRWSLGLDANILLRTVALILRDSKAY
jgi:putative colanic acid biosynthesis UDP-glucose lipid carrier transferase